MSAFSDWRYWVCTMTFFIQSHILFGLRYTDTFLGTLLVFFVTLIPYYGCAYVFVEARYPRYPRKGVW